MEAMQDSLTKLQDMFIKRMDIYQSELQATTPSASISSLSADFVSFRNFIMSALHSLQEQLQLLANQVDTIEMRSRRKILLIHGLDEQKSEDTVTVATNMINKQLKIADFCASDIARCHRMGRQSSSTRPRPILVKLRDLEMRTKIWGAKTALKGSGVTLSEFLTKSRHDAFMEARKKYGISRSWTRDGFVFLLGADGERHRVSSVAEVNKIDASDSVKTAAAVAKDPPEATKTRRAAAASKK